MKLIILALCLLLVSCTTIRGNTPCQRNARYQGEYYAKRGYEVRYGHGFYENEPHMWCEYKKDNQWLMARDTIWFVGEGYPRSVYRGYTVTWYGVKQKY